VKILLLLQIGVGAEKILLIKVTHILEVVKILLHLQIGVGAEKILLIHTGAGKTLVVITEVGRI
jgi:hypothetical protein